MAEKQRSRRLDIRRETKCWRNSIPSNDAPQSLGGIKSDFKHGTSRSTNVQNDDDVRVLPAQGVDG